MATVDLDMDAINPDSMFNYDDASISPSASSFPSGLFASSSSSQQDEIHPYLSRPPSLSPSSQTASLFNQSSLSPPSSASPRSVLSMSSQDEMLLGNSFSSSELDMLLFQSGIDAQAQSKAAQSGQPFFLPPADLFNQMPSQDANTLNLLDLVNDLASGDYPGHQPMPVVQTPSLPMTNNMFQAQPAQPKFDIPPMLRASGNKPAVTKAAPVRKQPPQVNTASSSSSAPPPEKPTVGKHNKTERRYRQKVQAAQADLRDSVPALRVLYGTSTPEQLATTDIRADDGTVDGLGEFNRPNASAKTTIFLGARLYIELLQKRVASLQRRVDELETFRLVVAGEDNLNEWKEDFDQREAVIAAAESAKAKAEQDSYDEDEESEEEEPKRKKARVVKPKATKAPAAKKGGDLKSFAAFAITFSLLPSAGTLFGSEVQQDVTGKVYSNGSATTSQVLRRLPLITAEHTSRLLARGLPAALTPSPTALVDWTWRLLLAVVFALVIRTVLGRKKKDERKGTLGNLPVLAMDVVQAYAPFGKADKSELPSLVELASQVVGGVTDLPKLAQFHLALRLGRIADDAQSLALLALLQSSFPVLSGSPAKIWASARDAATPETPQALQQVLALSFSEAKRAVALLPQTSSPLTAMSEQITLVHLNDLYSRFFVQLVDGATTGGQRVPDSVKALLANLESRNVGDTLHAALFDQEIRGVVQGVPKGTAAHALGLVLIGLWGLLTGPSPSAQAALATALAAEEVRGVGASLASVGALRELLYPGSKMMTEGPLCVLPRNATTIDKLALVCIQFIQLLATTASINAQQTQSPLDASRRERMERSLNVQKVTMDIRLALPSTTFHGIDHSDGDDAAVPAAGEENDDEVHEFECARERLVSVLSVVGRRAAGRVNGDQDSGVEVDFDEL